MGEGVSLVTLLWEGAGGGSDVFATFPKKGAKSRLAPLQSGHEGLLCGILVRNLIQ